MLTQDDLQAIGALVDEKLKQQDIRFDEKLKQQDARFDEKLKQQDHRFDEKLAKEQKEILKGVGDHFHDELSPLLDEYAGRITRLEEHTQHPPGTPLGIPQTSLSDV